MSYYEKRQVKMNLAGDAELSATAKVLLEMLAERNPGMDIVLDGDEVDLAQIQTKECLDIVEFEFEYFSADAFTAYENLLKSMSNSENKAGALVEYSSDFGSHIEAYGAYITTTTNEAAGDSKWGTGSEYSIEVRLNLEQLKDAYECELDDLAGNAPAVVFDNQDKLTDYLFGAEIAEALSIEEDTLDEYYFEDNYLSFMPDGAWRYGTFSEFEERKATFEKAVRKVQSLGGTLTVYWNLEDSDEMRENVLVATDGSFAELKFQTGPNFWDDFTVVSYSLK